MASSNLPLQCTVCPRRSTFSDVSHLLTHIASKGHLSHYFKLKVRSTQDQEARDQVDAYDAWYSHWNVENLMHERMRHKDKRRSQLKTQGPSRKAQRKQLPTKLALDPMLGSPFMYDDSLRPSTMPPETAATMSFSMPPPQLPRPQMHLWCTRRPYSYAAIPIEMPDQDLTPLDIGSSFFHLQDNAEELEVAIQPHKFDEEFNAENTKLKGIFWPGMNIFDSATTEMRKKRNQKKDFSVLEHLEQSSLHVCPTEMVFFKSGVLKKHQPITGRVESSSSPEPVIELRRKCARISRSVLTNKDVNGAKGRTRTCRGKKSHILPQEKLQDNDDDTHLAQVDSTKHRASTVYRDKGTGSSRDVFGQRPGSNVFGSGHPFVQNLGKSPIVPLPAVAHSINMHPNTLARLARTGDNDIQQSNALPQYNCAGRLIYSASAYDLGNNFHGGGYQTRNTQQSQDALNAAEHRMTVHASAYVQDSEDRLMDYLAVFPPQATIDWRSDRLVDANETYDEESAEMPSSPPTNLKRSVTSSPLPSPRARHGSSVFDEDRAFDFAAHFPSVTMKHE